MGARISSVKSAEAGKHVAWQDFEYGILESAATVPFVKVNAAEPRNWRPEDYSAGLLFGKRAELRWRRRRDGQFHLGDCRK